MTDRQRRKLARRRTEKVLDRRFFRPGLGQVAKTDHRDPDVLGESIGIEPVECAQTELASNFEGQPLGERLETSDQRSCHDPASRVFRRVYAARMMSSSASALSRESSF